MYHAVGLTAETVLKKKSRYSNVHTSVHAHWLHCLKATRADRGTKSLLTTIATVLRAPLAEAITLSSRPFASIPVQPRVPWGIQRCQELPDKYRTWHKIRHPLDRL